MTSFKRNMPRTLACILLAAVLWACGDNDTFTVEGTVADNLSINLRFLYYNNNVLEKGITASRDGKFKFSGVAANPTVLEILDNDFRPLGRLYVVNGDRIKCNIVNGDPYAFTASGNDITKRLCDFYNTNRDAFRAGSTAAANEAVEKFIAGHPDDIVSSILLVSSYDSSTNALRADSIMSEISQEARPGWLVDKYNSLLQRLVAQTAAERICPIPFYNLRDSLVDFRPSARRLSLIALSDNASGRPDSIVPAFRRLSRKSLRPDLTIVDFSMDRDTIEWHRSVRPDSASWLQGWAPSAIAAPGVNRLGIPSIPYFILVDSTGQQIMRTNSISLIEKRIDELTK